MKLEYTIDKTNRMITLTLLKDISESEKILHYIERELSLENFRYSMNERVLFLESCEKRSEVEKNVLNIKYLNGDEGLSEVLNIICTYLGTNTIIMVPESSTVEDVVDFDIPYKQRFDAVIAASTPDKSRKISESSSPQTKRPIPVSEQLADQSTFCTGKPETALCMEEANSAGNRNMGSELTPLVSDSSVYLGEGVALGKECQLSLQPQESPNTDPSFTPKQPSEFVLTSFQESCKKSHKKRRKSSPESLRSVLNISEPQSEQGVQAQDLLKHR